MRFRVNKPEDLDHVIVSSVDEYSRVWWMNFFNLILLQWLFLRCSAEYRHTHQEMPVLFLQYRWRFAIPGTGWF